MEYEIEERLDTEEIDGEDGASRDGGIVEDHIALRNQSSVRPEDYPRDERREQSLVRTTSSE